MLLVAGLVGVFRNGGKLSDTGTRFCFATVRLPEAEDKVIEKDEQEKPGEKLDAVFSKWHSRGLGLLSVHWGMHTFLGY